MLAYPDWPAYGFLAVLVGGPILDDAAAVAVEDADEELYEDEDDEEGPVEAAGSTPAMLPCPAARWLLLIDAASMTLRYVSASVWMRATA